MRLLVPATFDSVSDVEIPAEAKHAAAGGYSVRLLFARIFKRRDRCGYRLETPEGM